MIDLPISTSGVGPSFRERWLPLASFLIGFIAIWLLNLVWGVSMTMGGRWLGIPETLRFSISRIGGLTIQIGVFAIITRRVLNRSLWDIAFPKTARPGWT